MLWTLSDFRAWWHSSARYRWMRALGVALGPAKRAVPTDRAATACPQSRQAKPRRIVRAWRDRTDCGAVASPENALVHHFPGLPGAPLLALSPTRNLSNFGDVL
jgi:hypothetical protein